MKTDDYKIYDITYILSNHIRLYRLYIWSQSKIITLPKHFGSTSIKREYHWFPTLSGLIRRIMTFLMLAKGIFVFGILGGHSRLKCIVSGIIVTFRHTQRTLIVLDI